MNIITPILLLLLFSLLWFLKVNNNKLIIVILVLIPISFVLKVLGNKSLIILHQISSFTENVIILFLILLILQSMFKNNKSIFSYKIFVFSSIGFITIYLIHNLIDYEVLLSKYWVSDIRIVSPWSVFIFIAFWGIIIVKEEIELQVLNYHWRTFLLILSLSFITLFILTFLLLIEGNVDKSFLGTGGIGLNNYSTNETGFFSFVLGFSWFLLFRKECGFKKIFPAIFIAIFFIITILTKSRISSLAFFIVVLGNIFLKQNNLRLRVFIFLSSLIPLYFGFDQLLERFQTDYRTSYNYLLPEIPITGSGRTIIWFYFIRYFFSSDFITILFGTGDVGLIRIYDSTPLKNLGIYSASTHSFLPLHSEIFDILISSGFLGIILLCILIYEAKKVFDKSLDFNIILTCILLVFFIDMVVYNSLALAILSFNIILFVNKPSLSQ